VTFVPCFLFIFLGAPYVERLRGNRHLTAALNGITAAVVGVIASLAAYFAVHNLFSTTRRVDLGPALLDLPVWTSISPVAVGITVVALFLIFGRGWSPLRTLAVCAAVGLAIGLVGLLR
jgi:chromate transporter